MLLQKNEIREEIKNLTQKLSSQQKSEQQTNVLKYTTVHLKQKSSGNFSHLMPNKMHKLLSQRASNLNVDLIDVVEPKRNPIYDSKVSQRQDHQVSRFNDLESGGRTIETTPFKKYSEYKQISEEQRFESQREPIRIPQLNYVIEPESNSNYA